jgi:hypothetical protein
VSYYIAAVHLASGTETKHISEVIWVDTDREGEKKSLDQVIGHISAHPHDVWVRSGGKSALVEVVHAKPLYIRSEPDSSKRDNLLSIPRY